MKHSGQISENVEKNKNTVFNIDFNPVEHSIAGYNVIETLIKKKQ